MTTPCERTRAIRFGRDALRRAANDPSLDPAMQARVQEILSVYPEQLEVLRWIGANVRVLPEHAVKALSAASVLLHGTEIMRRASTETARSVEYARRHYPYPDDCDQWVTDQRFWTIREWLLPEGYYDTPNAVASHPDLDPARSIDAWTLRGINELARLSQLDELERQAGTRPQR